MSATIGLLAVTLAANAVGRPWDCDAVAWCGDRIVGGGGGLVVVGALGREPASVPVEGVVRDLASDRVRVAVACDWAGVRLLRVEEEPRVVATISSGDAALAVDLRVDLLAIAEATAGVSVYELHGESPALLRRWELAGEIVDVQFDGSSLWAAAADGRYWRLDSDRVSGPWSVEGGAPPRFVRLDDGLFLARGEALRRLADGVERRLEQPIVGGGGRWLAAGPAGVLDWAATGSTVPPVSRAADALAWDLALKGDHVALAAGPAGITLWQGSERRDLLYRGRIAPRGETPLPWTRLDEPVAAARAPYLAQVGAVSLEEGAALAVVVDEDLAFVAAGASGMRVVDVSRPSLPVEIGVYDSPAETPVYLHDLVFYEGHVIAGCDGAEDEKLFRILDVSSPSDPVLIAAWPGSYSWVYGMDVSPGRLYVAGAWGRGHNYSDLWIFDIREVDTPREIGGMDMGGSATFWSQVTVDRAADGETLYSWHGPWRFYWLDATDPRSIGRRGYLWGMVGQEMETEGDLLHQALGGLDHGGYRVLRIDHEGGYELEGELALPGGTLSELALHDDLVFGTGSGWLWVIDVSDSTAPELLLDPLSVPGVTDVFVDEDGYIYLTVAGEGLRIYRLIG